MRGLIALATTAIAAALLAPVAIGGGATQFSESWTNEPSEWFTGQFACAGQPTTVAGTGLESGSVNVTETTNGGEHVRPDVQGYADLYGSGVTHGPIVFVEGGRAVLKVSFVFLVHDGDVSLFFAKATCAGE